MRWVLPSLIASPDKEAIILPSTASKKRVIAIPGLVDMTHWTYRCRDGKMVDSPCEAFVPLTGLNSPRTHDYKIPHHRQKVRKRRNGKRQRDRPSPNSKYTNNRGERLPNVDTSSSKMNFTCTKPYATNRPQVSTWKRWSAIDESRMWFALDLTFRYIRNEYCKQRDGPEEQTRGLRTGYGWNPVHNSIGGDIRVRVSSLSIGSCPSRIYLINLSTWKRSVPGWGQGGRISSLGNRHLERGSRTWPKHLCYLVQLDTEQQSSATFLLVVSRIFEDNSTDHTVTASFAWTDVAAFCELTWKVDYGHSLTGRLPQRPSVVGCCYWFYAPLPCLQEMAVAAGRVSCSWITETRTLSNCQSSAYGSRLSNVSCIRLIRSRRSSIAVGLSIRSEAEARTESGSSAEQDRGDKKKVVVVGAGWAGLGAAHHLSKQVNGCADWIRASLEEEF